MCLLLFCSHCDYPPTFQGQNKKLTNTSKPREVLFQTLLQLLIQRPCWKSLKFKCRHIDTAGLTSPVLGSIICKESEGPEESADHAKPHQLEITYKAVWTSSQSLPSGKVQMLTWVWNGATLKTLNTGISHRFRGMHRKGRCLVPKLFVMPGLVFGELSQWVKKNKKEEKLESIIKLTDARMGHIWLVCDPVWVLCFTDHRSFIFCPFGSS